MLLNCLYCVAFLALLPWMAWRRISGGRPVAAPFQRFTGSIPALPPKPAGTARIWLHGVSVGEVHLLATLAGEIRRQALAAGRPVDCVISSSTTTGLAVAANRFGAERVFPCPLDFTWAVNRVLDRVAPDVLVLGELELWPHLLSCTAARSVPIVVANARLSPRSFRGYGRIRLLVAAMLRRVTLVLARSQEDGDRFSHLGARDVRIRGSMKFDGVKGDRGAPEVASLRRLAGFADDDTVFLAGSTQAPEEQLALEAFRSLHRDHPHLRLVIVPRHVERTGELARLLDDSGLCWQARSQLTTAAADPDPDARVLLIDTTGELAWWWGTAAIAFVGGSLDGRRGGQNMLEPAAYGAAVCFGPFTGNFRDEVGMLLTAQGAEVVADGAALTAFVARCLQAPARAEELGRRAAETVARQRGATAATATDILRLLDSSAPQHSGCGIRVKSG